MTANKFLKIFAAVIIATFTVSFLMPLNEVSAKITHTTIGSEPIGYAQMKNFVADYSKKLSESAAEYPDINLTAEQFKDKFNSSNSYLTIGSIEDFKFEKRGKVSIFVEKRKGRTVLNGVDGENFNCPSFMGIANAGNNKIKALVFFMENPEHMSRSLYALHVVSKLREIFSPSEDNLQFQSELLDFELNEDNKIIFKEFSDKVVVVGDMKYTIETVDKIKLLIVNRVSK